MRTRLLALFALVAILWVVSLVLPHTSAANAQPPRHAPLQQLWNKYPLNPQPSGPSTSRPPAPQPPAFHERDTARPSQSGSSARWLGLVGIAAGALALASAVVLLLRTGRLHVTSVQLSGGAQMTDFVHRFRHREPASEETSEQPMPNRSWSLLKGYTRALDELGPRSSGEGRPGMHEDAIRRAAETAREKLDQAIAATLEDARRQAEKITWDAEGLRRRAEQESKELRDGADAYAAKKRREAEKAAAKIVTEAEERARKVGRDELDRVAKRRSDLTQEIRFAEERLYQLSTGLDELALRLKQIVYPEQTGEPSNGRPTDEAPKEDLDSAVLEEQVQR